MERNVGPQFSCTVDGDGPPMGDMRTRFVTWNVNGIADSSDGSMNSKRMELEQYITTLTNNHGVIHLIFLQETWLQCDDGIDMPNYEWLGRNRTKVDPDAQRGSGGIGVLVHTSIAPRVSVISRPTHGGSEGVMWIKVMHDSANTFDVFCNFYLEQQRQMFPVDNKQLMDGIITDWKKLSQASNAFILGDFNT